MLSEPAFKVNKSLLKTTYEYDLVKAMDSVSEKGGSQEEFEIPNAEEVSQAKAMMELMGLEITYSLEMPGKITESTVGIIEDGKLTVDIFEIAGKDSLYVKSEEAGSGLILIILVVVLVVVGAGAGAAVFVLRKK